MFTKIHEAVIILLRTLYEFLNLNFKNIHFLNKDLAYMVGAGIIVAVVIKLSWLWLRRRKTSHKQSGFEVSKYYRRGFVRVIINIILAMVLILAVTIFLVVLAEPFFSQTKEETKVTESRIRIDLRDVSISMEAVFQGTSRSKAQVAAEAHLEFLKMRQGKNDRTSYWLFASYPHKVEDFIIDDELYYQQVADSYWIVGWDQITLDNYLAANPDYYIPRERFGIIGDGGGTDMVLALKAIIKQFDEDKFSKRKDKKSVLIITDAEVAVFPQKELLELKERKIIPFIIWIKSPPRPPDEDEDYEGSGGGYNSYGGSQGVPEFVRRIKEYGGEYFDVRDEQSLKKAFQAIDRLETVKVETTKKLLKISLFQTFLSVAILILIASILLKLIKEPFGVYP